MTAYPFENPILRELASLINSGKVVLEIVYGHPKYLPKQIFYIIRDEDDHILDVDFTQEQFDLARQNILFWWTVMKKVKLDGQD